MNTSIVIPTKNNIDTIDKCLSSLMPYYGDGYISEIIVVDGHSTDGTLEAVKRYPVKVLFEEVKGSIGLAYDIGWRNAQGELVILFDSDVYLGEGFFPRIHELLSDEVGWISCVPEAVVTNRMKKTQGEDWSRGMLTPEPSRFQRLYTRIAYGGTKEPLCGGPCMVVRRSCLEAVNGFLGLSPGTLKCCGDISVSQRVAGKGWKTIWWHEAPLYHHPRSTLKGLVKQMHGYGISIAYMHLENEFRKSYPWYNKVISMLARLASPAIGVYLAIRFRNPMHLITYPLPRYAVVAGYVAGWIGAKRVA
jgi:glycosyltransferase involved in cell wall biosynthesis